MPAEPFVFYVVVAEDSVGDDDTIYADLTNVTAAKIVHVVAMKSGVKLTYDTPQSKEQIIEQLTPFANKHGVDFSVIPVVQEASRPAFSVRQTELTRKQLKRQDLVDNAMRDILQEAADIFDIDIDGEWDIDHISRIRDIVDTLVCDKLKLTASRQFYPSLITED